MRTPLRITSLALAVALAAPWASASSGDVVMRTLGNGVTLVVAPNPWNRVVAISVVVDAGSKYDPPELRGLARVTNEFLICGTPRMPRAELEETVDSGGIKIGTYTTEDVAEVYAVAAIDQFDDALAVVAALVTDPAFDERDLARAQNIVSEEQERSLSDPFDSCYAKLSEIMYGSHPYAFPPGGTRDGVAAVTRADVARFYSERYRGGGIVVAVVGNLDPDDAMRKLGEGFAACPSGRARDADFPAPERAAPAVFEFHRDVPQGYVTVGFPAPPVGSDDCAAVSVLGSVFGDSKARFGGMQEALVSDGAGVASVAGAVCAQRVESGRLVLFASTSAVDAALDKINELVAGLRNRPVSREDLARAKGRLVGIRTLRGEPNLEQARRLATDVLTASGIGFTEKLLREVEAVDAADVQRAAEKYLADPVTVILRPGRTSRTQL